MIKYILRRLFSMLFVLLGVTLLVFMINYLSPSDPVSNLLGSNYTQEQYHQKEAELGLDKPFLIQFATYAKNIVTKLDLGTSYSTKRPVSAEIGERFWVTIKLGLIGIAITVIIGVPFGIISATKQNSPLDYTVTMISLFFASMPPFWMAMMMMLIFALSLGWLPASGLSSWSCYIMPALAIGLSPVATVTRQTRSSMLEVIRQDYIRTARAKGVPNHKVISKHALRNALIPVVTIIGMQLGQIVAGSTVIEAIFSIQGIGALLITAINKCDYPVIRGCVLVLSISICLMNLVVDLLYGFIDPRIMSQIGGGRRRIKPIPATVSVSTEMGGD